MNNFTNSLVLSEFCLNKKRKLLVSYSQFRLVSVGQVITAHYFFPARDGLKKRSFTGVCLTKVCSNSNFSITLRNSYRSNSVEMSVNLKSPLLLSLEFSYWYRRKVRLSKLYFIRTLRQKSFTR